MEKSKVKMHCDCQVQLIVVPRKKNVTELKTTVLEKASTISTVNFLSFQDGQKNVWKTTSTFILPRLVQHLQTSYYDQIYLHTEEE